MLCGRSKLSGGLLSFSQSEVKPGLGSEGGVTARCHGGGQFRKAAARARSTRGGNVGFALYRLGESLTFLNIHFFTYTTIDNM